MDFLSVDLTDAQMDEKMVDGSADLSALSKDSKMVDWTADY